MLVIMLLIGQGLGRLSPSVERVIRVRDTVHDEVVEAAEVVRVAGVDRKLLGDGNCCNECIESPSGWLSPTVAEGSRHTPEGPSRGSVEGKRLEVGFCLLQMDLPGGSLVGRRSDQRTH